MLVCACAHMRQPRHELKALGVGEQRTPPAHAHPLGSQLTCTYACAVSAHWTPGEVSPRTGHPAPPAQTQKG